MPFIGNANPSMFGGSYKPPSARYSTIDNKSIPVSKGAVNGVSTLLPSINSASTVSNNARNTANNSGFSYATRSGSGASSSSSISDWYALSSQNSALSQSYAREQMAFQSLEAQKNRDWQERMSNTAYQRAVKDLQASGLNPILAYQNGGATVNSVSTPSGASGNVDNSFISALSSLAIASLNSATSLAIADKQVMSSIYASDNSLKSSKTGTLWKLGEYGSNFLKSLFKK